MAASEQKTKPLHIWFTQDALDGDNLSSARGVALYAQAEAVKRGCPVLVFVDVSTAMRDFSRPRYNLARGEEMNGEPLQIPNVGIKKMLSDNKLLDFKSDPDLMIDSELAQEFDGRLLLLAMKSALSRDSSTVELIPVRGEITRQGLWDNIVPNTHFYVDLSTATARTWDEVQRLEAENEPFPADKKYKTYSAAAEGEDQRIKRRENHRRFITGQIRGELKFLDVDVAVRRMVEEEVSADVEIVICAPMGSVQKLLRALEGTPERVTKIVGDVLTTDPKDNLVGQQWNEYLDQAAAQAVIGMIQSNTLWRGRSTFVTTQLLKHNELVQALVQRINDAAALQPLENVVAGFQVNWNKAKSRPQPIYDPAAVLLLQQPDIFKKVRFTVNVSNPSQFLFTAPAVDGISVDGFSVDGFSVAGISVAGIAVVGADGINVANAPKMEAFYRTCYDLPLLRL